MKWRYSSTLHQRCMGGDGSSRLCMTSRIHINLSAVAVFRQNNEMATKRKEIYKYTAPWTVYSMNWSIRPDKRFRLALGSFVEEYNNKAVLIDNPETEEMCYRVVWYVSGSDRVARRRERRVFSPGDVRPSVSDHQVDMDPGQCE